MLDIKSVINNLPLAVLAVNQDRRVLIANPAAQAFAGKDESALIGRRGGEIMGCIHAGDDPQGCGHGPACDLCELKNAVLKAFSEQTDIPTFDTVAELAEAGQRDLRATVTYLPPDADPELGSNEPTAILTIEDVTAVNRSNRLSAAMVTIGLVSHEMSQPLMATLGALERLQLEHPELDRIPVAIGRIMQIAELLQRLKSIRNYSTRVHDTSGSRMLCIGEKAA